MNILFLNSQVVSIIIPRGANRAVAKAGVREIPTIPLEHRASISDGTISGDDQTKMALASSDKNKKASQKIANVESRNAARKPHLVTHLANVQYLR